VSVELPRAPPFGMWTNLSTPLVDSVHNPPQTKVGVGGDQFMKGGWFFHILPVDSVDGVDNPTQKYFMPNLSTKNSRSNAQYDRGIRHPSASCVLPRLWIRLCITMNNNYKGNKLLYCVRPLRGSGIERVGFRAEIGVFEV
jgi:hypothetical protein